MRADLFEHDASLVGDADRLEEVIVNILWNAVNHTPPDGSILVECSSNNRRHRIIVLDTGTGIARALLPAVFEPFGGETASVPAAITRGAGLGLAVTKAIVTAHGGDIVVSSDGEGRGTMVTVTLPVS
jgi:signal transduction histidine kinase